MTSFLTRKKDTSRIQFAYYAHLDSPIGDVFQYLLRNRAHPTHQGKKMGIRAISAFWKPFSAQSILKLSDLEVEAIALASITELQRQIDLIWMTFNIPIGPKEITRTDIERMIEERLNSGRNINQEPVYELCRYLTTTTYVVSG